jgi:hypothetical protein
MKRLVALFSAVILIAPPAPAAGKTIMVGVCGGDKVRIPIPVKAPLPGKGDDHSCCKKGCHVANERKKRADGSDDDVCC